eukprot:TRINITY_DN8558_c0_g1_i1.p2 TRINITY_DN8558_c0_g1~~TRINITY_DN8558_c0_g1_i1.p2  ORF type:complete len:181 (-),score=23.76 TRINITY_DN8558_c0_g1_i1:250-792(-)
MSVGYAEFVNAISRQQAEGITMMINERINKAVQNKQISAWLLVIRSKRSSPVMLPASLAIRIKRFLGGARLAPFPASMLAHIAHAARLRLRRELDDCIAEKVYEIIQKHLLPKAENGDLTPTALYLDAAFQSKVMSYNAMVRDNMDPWHLLREKLSALGYVVNLAAKHPTCVQIGIPSGP